MGEFLSDTARAFRRSLPVLLPGFAWLAAYRFHGSALETDITLGGALLAMVLLFFMCAIYGLIVQGTRCVTFDWIRSQIHKKPLNRDSGHALHYALWANAATLWPPAVIYYLTTKGSDAGMVVTAAVVGLLVELGFIQAAMNNYHDSIKPARARKKTKA